MENKKVVQSERGGKSAIDGFKFERDIIAFLSIRMYCNTEKFAKIICEYRNDIEIEVEDRGIYSWQVKRTDSSKLPKKEIFDSIELFHEINNMGTYSGFVLLCNKDLANTSLDRVDLKSFSYLREKFPNFNKMLRELPYESSFLSKLYFIKGPKTDSIRSVIKEEMKCISEKDNFLDKLNALIEHIWSGIACLSERKIIQQSKIDDPTKEFKTINKKRLSKFESSVTSLIDSEISFIDDSPNVLNKSIFELEGSKVEELVTDFWKSEFRYDVLIELSRLSSTHFIYRHEQIMKVLETVTSSNDEHDLQQLFSILINILRISKE